MTHHTNHPTNHPTFEHITEQLRAFFDGKKPLPMGEQADDLVQQTWERFLRSNPNRAPHTGLLYAIARSVLKDAIKHADRQRRARGRTVLADHDTIDAQQDLSTSVYQSLSRDYSEDDLRSNLANLNAGLSDRESNVFVMRCMGDSDADIGAALGMTADAVKVCASRAKKKLLGVLCSMENSNHNDKDNDTPGM